jgi:hypothetical protein
VAIKTIKMKIDVQIWDSKNGKFHKETIDESDLADVTRQKILSWYDTKKESLVDFEILNININN